MRDTGTLQSFFLQFYIPAESWACTHIFQDTNTKTTTMTGHVRLSFQWTILNRHVFEATMTKTRTMAEHVGYSFHRTVFNHDAKEPVLFYFLIPELKVTNSMDYIHGGYTEHTRITWNSMLKLFLTCLWEPIFWNFVSHL